MKILLFGIFFIFLSCKTYPGKPDPNQPLFYYSSAQVAAGYSIKYVKVQNKYWPWTDFEFPQHNKFIDRRWKDLLYVGQGPVFYSVPDSQSIKF